MTDEEIAAFGLTVWTAKNGTKHRYGDMPPAYLEKTAHLLVGHSAVERLAEQKLPMRDTTELATVLVEGAPADAAEKETWAHEIGVNLIKLAAHVKARAAL